MVPLHAPALCCMLCAVCCIQYPKAQITCLVATLLVVVLTNTVAHFFVACGTWQVGRGVSTVLMAGA